MRAKSISLFFGLIFPLAATAQSLEKIPPSPLAEFHALKAPSPKKHFLHEGDRLAICGDSITEQKMYSRIMETYLTVCVPELNISVRQYGWSGEKAAGFLGRMTNDCLRFKPTVATTCYGMNDHEYRAYSDRIGKTYREKSAAIIDSFKANGVRVIMGSPGCVGKHPSWVGDPNATIELMNLNLCELRNIGIQLASQERVGFADVFWPMIIEGQVAQFKYGDYALAGKDGVHPGWAGHLVMAYAFLHSFGLDGDLADFSVDLASNEAKVSAGHELLGFSGGELKIKSSRYPFCIGDGDITKDDNIRSGTRLVPFNQELNRFTLTVKHAKAKSYKVTWGTQSKTFNGEVLERGINLAEEFPKNPFSDVFKKVDDAVGAKQAYETKQIKEVFRSAAAKSDMEGTAAKTEQEREPLAAAIKDAFVPVTHSLTIIAE